MLFDFTTLHHRDAYVLDLSPLADSDLTPVYTWTRICLQPTPKFPSMAYLSASSIPAAGQANGGALLLWGSRHGVKGKERFSHTEAMMLTPCYRPSLAPPALSQPTKPVNKASTTASRNLSTILAASSSGIGPADVWRRETTAQSARPQPLDSSLSLTTRPDVVRARRMAMAVERTSLARSCLAHGLVCV